MDETMIYTHGQDKNGQIIFDIRPGLFDFLNEISKYFIIYVWTFGEKNYADNVLDRLEKLMNKKLFEKRFYLESASKTGKFFWKNLRNIHKEQNDVFLIDDIYENGSFQSANFIHIKPFKGQRNDTELSKVINICKKLKNVKDVRPVIRKYALYAYDCSHLHNK